MANYRKMTRKDYARMIAGSKKGRRSGKRRHSRQLGRRRRKRVGKLTGGVMIPDLLLANLISRDNRNAIQRQALIDTMNMQQMRRIGRVVRGFLNSRYKMSNKQLKALAKNRDFVMALVNRNVPLTTKKQVLKQKGGFLGALLPLATSVLAKPLTSLIGKILK